MDQKFDLIPMSSSNKTPLEEKNRIFQLNIKTIFGNRYDFSMFEYVNSKTKGNYKCPVHGMQTGIYLNFMKGRGCYDCGREQIAKTRIKNAGIKFHEEMKWKFPQWDFTNFDYQGDKITGCYLNEAREEIWAEPSKLQQKYKLLSMPPEEKAAYNKSRNDFEKNKRANRTAEERKIDSEKAKVYQATYRAKPANLAKSRERSRIASKKIRDKKRADDLIKYKSQISEEIIKSANNIADRQLRELKNTGKVSYFDEVNCDIGLELPRIKGGRKLPLAKKHQTELKGIPVIRTLSDEIWNMFFKPIWLNHEDDNRSYKIYFYMDLRTGIIIYVGQTVQSFGERHYGHLQDVLAIDLHIQEQGLENFTMLEVHQGLNSVEVNLLECYYIELFKTFKEDHGFNRNKGGQNSTKVAEIAIQPIVDMFGNYVLNVDGDPAITYSEQMIGAGLAYNKISSLSTGNAENTRCGYRLALGNVGIPNPRLIVGYHIESGRIEYMTNKREFSNANGMSDNSIFHVMDGRIYQTNGWMFKRYDKHIEWYDMILSGKLRPPTRREFRLGQDAQEVPYYYAAADIYFFSLPYASKILGVASPTLGGMVARNDPRFHRVTWDEYYNHTGWIYPKGMEIPKNAAKLVNWDDQYYIDNPEIEKDKAKRLLTFYKDAVKTHPFVRADRSAIAKQLHADDPTLAQRIGYAKSRKNCPNLVNALGNLIIPDDEYQQLLIDEKVTVTLLSDRANISKRQVAKLISGETDNTLSGIRLAEGNTGVTNPRLFCIMNLKTLKVVFSANSENTAHKLKMSTSGLDGIIRHKHSNAREWVCLPITEATDTLDQYRTGKKRIPTLVEIQNGGSKTPCVMEGYYYTSMRDAANDYGYKSTCSLYKKVKSEPKTYYQITWDQYYDDLGCWPDPSQITITYDL